MKKIKKQLKNIRKSISFFDLSILVLLGILSIVLFFFFYRKSEFIEIRVKVTDQDVLFANSRPDFFYAEHFVVGDTERNSLGAVISEIINVERYPLKDGEDLVFVDLRVKATYDSRSQTYSARGQNIAYGSPTRFFMGSVTFDGFIVDFPGKETRSNIQEKRIQFTIRQKDMEPEIAEKIAVGDAIYDSDGNQILTVAGLRIKPAAVGTVHSDGRLRIDSRLKDIDVTIEADVQQVGDTYLFFHDTPIFIGEATWFRIGNYSIRNGIIIDVQEVAELEE